MSHDTPTPMGRRRFGSDALRAVAAVWLSAPAGQIAAALRPLGQPRWQFFTETEAADVDAIASQIVPSGETAGAREAGIARFIDRALTTFAADQQALFRNGLGELATRSRGAGRFGRLADGEQVRLLQALERDGSPFFEAVRVATITGMFANPSYGGNTGKVGWRLIGFEDRFLWQPPFGSFDRPEPGR